MGFLYIYYNVNGYFMDRYLLCLCVFEILRMCNIKNKEMFLEICRCLFFMCYIEY